MIDGLKPYPTYKDSGEPWLGEVPEHWCVKRGKALFRCIDIRSPTGAEELLTVSSERGVVPRSSATVTMFKAESYVGYKLCWPGDLVINSLWAWSRGLGVSRHHGIVSSAYGVYRLRPGFEGYSHYIHQLVRSSPFHWELQVRSKGIWISRLQLTDESFLGAPFPVPPEPEQSAIVRFLDHADRRIHRYIRAKQKLIKLLEEQKQAIIRQAVTRGLDPNVRLKPSGVEWLGDVPAHWEVVALKRACRLLRDGTHLPPHRQASGIPLLSVRNIIGQHFTRRADDSLISQGDYEQLCRSFVPQTNDVLLAIVGATLGKAATVPEMEPFHIQRSLAVFRPKVDKLIHEFLEAYLRSPGFQRALWTTVAFSAQPGIYLNTLGSFSVLLPSLEEQKLIVEKLSTDLARTDRPILAAKQEISLLQEYRTRLIADVVTGKIDVCEASAKLPDEPQELDAIDAGEELEGAEDAADEVSADGETEEAAA